MTTVPISPHRRLAALILALALVAIMAIASPASAATRTPPR